ncbi:MAG: hypothetical protein ACREMQ_13555 [Longimicrobiales bacterium]
MYWPETVAEGRLARIRRRLRAALDPVIDGFEEHGWSGKLYLLTHGGTLAFTIVGAFVAVIAAGFFSVFGLPFFGPMMLLPVLVVTVPLGYISWKILSGIARFRRWAWYFGVFGSFAGVFGGLGFLGLRARAEGSAGVMIALLEAALSAQFLVYFIRNRDRFK